MPDHRTPRAFRSPAPSGPDPELPAVSPALVEWLEREFPIQLSPLPGFAPTASAESVLTHQAAQVGIRQVIDRLRNLSNNQE